MPCLDGRDAPNVRYETVYQDNPEHLKKAKEMEAALCAVFTELERDGNLGDVIKRAETNGEIDLVKFWNKHKKEDENRLRKDLEKFSEHERAIIKDILNNKW
jgi:hypothetical protein